MTPVRRSAAERRTATGARSTRRRRSPARPATPPAFPQRADASPRQLARFELVRARTAVLAAVQGLGPAGAERAATRRWSIREVILHLHARDLEWARALEPAWRGVPPAWLDHGPRALARLDEERLAPLRELAWDAALRRLGAGHDRLLAAVEALPEQPAEPWTRKRPLGRILALIPEHDRHHAAVIQEARTAATPSPRTP